MYSIYYVTGLKQISFGKVHKSSVTESFAEAARICWFYSLVF